MARVRLVAISSFLIALTASAASVAPPPPPVFKIPQHSFKTLHFNWSSSVPGYHNNLLRSDDGGASYEVIASNLEEEWIEEVAVHEFDWLNTRYVVESCDGKCSRSAPVQPPSYELTGRIVAPTPLARTRFGSQLDLSGNGLTLVASRGPADLADGAVLFYSTIPGEGPVYLNQIRAPSEDRARDFGTSLALDDAAKTLAVSAPAARAIYVYECEPEDSCSWSLRQRLQLSRGALLGQVALSRDGSILAVATDSGVLMFGCTPSNCIQLAVLRPSRFKSGPIPEASLALDSAGTTLVVGVPESDPSGASEAYVFKRAGASWREAAILRAVDSELDAEFGASVSIDAGGGTIAVGAPGARADAGAVYVFEGVGSSSMTQLALEAPISEPGDRLGASIAISAAGDYVVAGATGEDGSAVEPQGNPYDNSNSNSGAAYSFVRGDSVWEHSAYIKGYADANASYGTAVAIDATGHTMAVGAPGDDGDDYATPSQTDSGRVHLY